MMAELDRLLIRDYSSFCTPDNDDIEHAHILNEALSNDLIERLRESNYDRLQIPGDDSKKILQTMK